MATHKNNPAGDLRKAASNWLFWGRRVADLPRFWDEAESGLSNPQLASLSAQIKGPIGLRGRDVLKMIISAPCAWVVFQLPGGAGFFGILFLIVPLAFLSEWYFNGVAAKAAALLAERGDNRAMTPLTRFWDAGGKTPFLTQTGERNFERWLAEEYAGMSAEAKEGLRGMIRRAFPYRRRFQYGDFSESATDILLAALRCLAQVRDSESRAVLHDVARFPLPPHAPNRALLRDMAVLFLEDPKPVVSLQRPATTVRVTPQQTITLGRKV